MNQHTENIITRINQLAAISEDSTGITRRFGTPAAVKAGNQLLEWMRAEGLQARIDAIGNIRAVWPSPDPEAKTFVIASHFDSVVNAGRWDGPLGVLTGLEILGDISRHNRKLPFHLELIAFSDEEGVRYHTTYLGSKVVAGSFDTANLLRVDEQGVSLQNAITAIGGDAAIFPAEAIPKDRWLGYFELHIEQGPVLYVKRIPVAPVTAIAGQVRAEVTFTGEAGHAGTTPMNMRRDALCGAAEFIQKVEQFAGMSTDGVLATVGKLQVSNAASNVIPGEVTLSVDIRHPRAIVLETAQAQLCTLAGSIARQRGLKADWRIIQTSLPVTCDPRLTTLLTQAIEAAGYPPTPLVSGAGHDAVPIAEVAPVCMLFVRCWRGISHHPQEHVEPEDLDAAFTVARNFIDHLDRNTTLWRYPH